MSNAMSALAGCAITPQMSGEEPDSRFMWPSPDDPDTINSQGEPVSDALITPSFEYNIERDAESGNIVSVLAKTPDGAMQQGFSRFDSIYHRSVAAADATHQEVVWRQYWVSGFTKTADSEVEVTLIHHPEASTHDAAVDLLDETDDKDARTLTVTIPQLAEELIASRVFDDPPSEWYTTARKWSLDGTATSRFSERYVPVGTEYEPVESCGDLTFEKIEGEGSQAFVYDFLNGDHTPAVEHNLGDTGPGYLAAFGAYYTPEDADDRKLMAVLTLDEHQNKAFFEAHNSVLISRLCCHPHCPKNTATWMIARARDWAADAGYDQVGSTAGVRFNRGTIYKAAGFELVPERTGWVDGDGWTNREGRSAVRDGNQWFKRKYEYEL